MILDTETVDRDVALDADVCVVGSGAGGAVVARELALAGRSVVVVEEGSYLVNRDFTQREDQMLPLLYAERGMLTTTDSTAVIAQGRVVGGSTVPSFCICVRLPRQVLAHWRTKFGLSSLSDQELTPFFEQVEAVAHVQPIPSNEVNANNEKLKSGADRLGFRNYVPSHNRIECLGCGFCALGCAYDRKGDALAVHLPAASRAGAKIIPNCRVEQTEARQGGFSLRGRFLQARSDKQFALSVKARTVVFAAGAVGTPALWLRSRLPNTHQQVGRNLHLQPQVVVGGVFSEQIEGWRGIPRSVIVDEFLDLERDVAGGTSLAGYFTHPIQAASLLPGFGADYQRLLTDYPRLALATVMLNDRTAGRVEVDASGEVSISYHLGDEDRSDLVDGMRRLADIYLASGAQRVILPYNELVELTRRGDYRAIDDHAFRANDPLLLAYHPQGTMRMGKDPKRSVIDEHGEAHEVKGLFVADASVFPTSTAVPPQLSTMAFALRTARYLMQR